MRRVLILGLIAAPLVSGCAGHRFDWQKTAENVLRGSCRGSSRCDLPCPTGSVDRVCTDQLPPGVVIRSPTEPVHRDPY